MLVQGPCCQCSTWSSLIQMTTRSDFLPRVEHEARKWPDFRVSITFSESVLVKFGACRASVSAFWAVNDPVASPRILPDRIPSP